MARRDRCERSSAARLAAILIALLLAATATGARASPVAACDARPDHPDRAVECAEQAIAAAYWQPAWRAHHLHLLADLHMKRGHWQAAVDAAGRAVAAAAGDRSRQVRAELVRSAAFRRMGAARRAEQSLERAGRLARDPCDRAWVSFELGVLHSDDQPAIARADFEAAIAATAPNAIAAGLGAPPRCPQAPEPDTLHQNLAWTDYLLHDDDRARAHLAALTDPAPHLEALLIHARLAARRGDLAAAAADLATARTLPHPDADWTWEIELLTGQLAEATGGAAATARAERAYRRSIAQVAALRRASPAGDAFAVSRYRAPYDGLIALLAERGRWREVLAVVLALDAGDMLRATAAPSHTRGTPTRLPARPHRPTVDAVVAAWRDRALVIVIAGAPRDLGPGRERVYRLRLDRGTVDGDLLGPADAARAWAARLHASPGDTDPDGPRRRDARAAARGLGALIVPATATDQPLHVLLLGALGQLPLAALRDDRGLVIARRPLLRVVSLLPRPPQPRADDDAVILADPERNLPSGLLEGAVVAAHLGVQPSLWTDATSERLWTARRARLLHIAAHVVDDDGLARLRLADRTVTAAEVVARGLAPRLAVLAGCGTAAAADEEGWGSLATALLHAGSEQVIANDRSIGDRDALALVRALYADPAWPADPARALARTQVAFAAATDAAERIRGRRDDDRTHPRDDDRIVPAGIAWAGFTVLAAPPEVAP